MEQIKNCSAGFNSPRSAKKSTILALVATLDDVYQDPVLEDCDVVRKDYDSVPQDQQGVNEVVEFGVVVRWVVRVGQVNPRFSTCILLR